MTYLPASSTSRQSLEGGEGVDAVAGTTGAQAKSGRKDMGRRIGFVRQQDFLVEHLTGEFRTFPMNQKHQLMYSSRNSDLCCQATTTA